MRNKGQMNAGDVVEPRAVLTIRSERIQIPDPERLVHLQFRRFAGCPVCNLHLHSFVRRYSEITAASIREVVVFHSTTEDLFSHAGNLPFSVVADPDKRLYADFGVGSARRALLDPRAWPAIAQGVLRSLYTIVREQRPVPPLKPHGGRFGLPADFLIASNGHVLASKYGWHADDQWSIDEILMLAREKRAISGVQSQRQTTYAF